METQIPNVLSIFFTNDVDNTQNYLVTLQIKECTCFGFSSEIIDGSG